MKWELEEETVKPEQAKESEGEKKASNVLKTVELAVFAVLQYVFLPVLCGLLTAGILKSKALEKIGLDRFNFAVFSTISFNGQTSSNHSGLMLAAGMGCILGMFFSRLMKFGAKLGHFDFISPPTSEDSMPIPSVKTFMMTIFRLVGIPAIVVLAAMSSLRLAQLNLLPGIVVEDELFEVTIIGIATVAAVGCLVMYLYDMMLSTVMRMMLRDKTNLKEIK